MEKQEFQYKEIKKMMHRVVIELYKAGFEKEGDAMSSLTHVIASQIEKPDLSTRYGIEYLEQCIEDHGKLIIYLNEAQVHLDKEWAEL